MVPLSVLDLASVAKGFTPADALADTTRLAPVIEQLGYKRMWVAEHHGMPAVASSAPAVLIGHLAEQFATLEALHPGRIDLGLGRAPGTDQVTARALRRSGDMGADTFPHDVVELIEYLAESDGPPSHPAPVPGRGYLPEMWLLGSSTFSAQLAGMLGLPFSFAYHFAPDQLDQALESYRTTFRPSFLLERPHAMVAVSVLCAPSEDEARWLAGPSALSILQLRTGRFGPIPTPEEAAAYRYTPQEQALVDANTSSHLVGDPDLVLRGLVELERRTGADELMLSTRAHSYEARAQSLTLVADRWSMDVSESPAAVA
jgi:luciferase family oxidoreductase group 1